MLVFPNFQNLQDSKMLVYLCILLLSLNIVKGKKPEDRLAVIFQNPARNNFWEAGIVMQSYLLDTVQ